MAVRVDQPGQRSSRRRKTRLGAGDRLGADPAVDDPQIDGLVVGQGEPRKCRAARAGSRLLLPGTSVWTGRSRPGRAAARPGLGHVRQVRGIRRARHAGAQRAAHLRRRRAALLPFLPFLPFAPWPLTARPTSAPSRGCPCRRPSRTSSCGPRRSGRQLVDLATPSRRSRWRCAAAARR